MNNFSSLANKCAILIPTYARPDILQYSLNRMRETWLVELPLLVYDDGSPNGEAINDVVNSWPEGRVIRGQQRLGQAAGRNILMRACRQENALLLDDDQYFLGLGNLKDLILSGAGSYDKTAVVTFARINKGSGRRDVPEWVPARILPVFQGGTALFHLPSVLSVGGFRDFWGFGYEEPELSIRLFLAGYKIWYDPSIIMEHNQFYVTKESRDFRLYDYHYARNAVLISTMNAPLWFGLSEGIIRSLRRMFVFKRNYSQKVKGLIHGITYTFRLWRERSPVSFVEYWRWKKFRNTGIKFLNSKR
jgi:GT2 family glycosyltransferase